MGLVDEKKKTKETGRSVKIESERDRKIVDK